MKKLTKLTLFTLSLSLITTPVFALTKEETVYSKLKADGSLNYTIVTEHLINDEKKETINDVSNLTDITNTNGNEKFEQIGNKLKWNSKGNDIYYEGKTKEELPISFKIKYELDNKEMKYKDIKGKSGNVKITIDYINNEKHNNLYTPFLVTTSTIIKTKGNSNINITNGKVISTGNNNVLVSIAVPNLLDSLGINSNINLNQTVITFKTDNFDLDEIYIVATPKLIDSSDLDILSNIDSLYTTLNKVSDATKKLEDGSKELKNGINTYNSKMNTYNSSMKQLSTGSTTMVNKYNEMSSGIKELNSKMPLLKAGTNEIVSSMNNLKTNVNTLATSTNQLYLGNTQLLTALNAASSQISITDIQASATTLATTKATLESKLSTLNTQISALETLNNPDLTDAIDTLKGIKSDLESQLNSTNTLLQQVTPLATYAGTVNVILNGNSTDNTPGLNNINESLGALNTGIKTLNDTLSSEEFTNKIITYSNGINELADGVNKLSEGNNKVVSGLSTLDSSIKTLSYYSNELTNASKTINDGATKLNDGINEFSNSINSVVKYINNNVKNVENKVKQLIKLSDDYTTFTMKDNNVDGTTKFIMIVDLSK